MTKGLSLCHNRLLILAELGLQGTTTIANAAWRYAPALVTVIQAQLDIIEAEEPTATGGNRQVSVATRLNQRDQLEIHLSRVRYHYCASSDELDATKELARISFQPRRPRGSISTPPEVKPTP